MRARRLSKAAAILGTVIAVLVASVAIVYGNAANPLPDSRGTGIISGTVQTNPDGSIKVLTGTVGVTVGGTWNWGTLSGSSVQNSCASRYGVGWSVDWWGISPLAVSGTTGLPIKGTNAFFHVTNTLDGLEKFVSPCARVDADGFPEGPWTAKRTYNAGETIPAKLCVNMYDLHGKPDAINNPTKELNPSLNGDNSVRTNDFNPATNAGYCFAPKLFNDSKIVTTATDGQVGGTISDKATLSGTVNATGTITFKLYSNPSCTTEVFSKTVTVSGNGTYDSGPYTPTAAGTYKWIASYGGDGNNTAATGKCDDAGETSNVIAKPDLGILKKGPARVELGNIITYTITVKNTGLIPVPNATFTDDIPADTTFVSAVPNCTNTAITITCNVGNLAVGATSAPVTVKVRSTKVGTVTNTAKVPTDDTPGDDTSTVTTRVVAPPPDLAILKQGPATVELGSDITYTITVKNTGILSVPNATFTDNLPSGTTFISAGPGCTFVAPTITCNVGTLAPNQTSAPVTIKVHPTAIGTVVNTAKVPTDRTPGDDTSTVTTVIVAPPGITLTVDKTVDATGDAVFADVETAPAPGGTVTYKVILKNTSTRSIRIDAVTDTKNGSTTNVCAIFIGITLAPGASSSPCTFTGTAPAAGTSVIDIITAKASEVGNSSNKGSAVDTAKVRTPPANPTNHFIEVDPSKRVDANGDETFRPIETATAGGVGITYFIDLLSSSDVPVKIESLTDTSNGVTKAVCGNLVGTIMQPGDFSLPCFYDGTAPPAGTSLTNTVIVTASEVGNPTNTTAESATAMVISPPPAGQPSLTLRINKTADANADGVFGAFETANKGGDPVNYQVIVTNTNSIPVTITKLTDTINGVTTNICAGLINTQLAAGAATPPCFFPGTAAPQGHDVIDIVDGTVAAVSNPSLMANQQRTAKVHTPAGAPPAISVDAVKTVDANADGTFSKLEAAPKAGGNVTYRVTIQNTSAVPVKVTAISDFLNGGTTNVCANLIGTVLQAGQSTAPCQFTAAAPPGGTNQPDVAIVTVVDTNNPANFASDSDTANVTRPL